MRECLTLSVFLLCFNACVNNQQEKLQGAPDNVSSRDTVVHSSDSVPEQIYFSFQYDTVIIDSKLFVARRQDHRNLAVLNEDSDTVFTYPEWTNEIEFVDFNDDGDSDILISHVTNVPGIQDLALYDAATGQFILVENFQDFPATHKIGGTRYYYSYHRSGCADSDWDSDLFIIDNYLVIRIGNIHGQGCEGYGKTGIFVSRIRNRKKELIQEFIRKPGYYQDKFEFIDRYWKKNYRRF